MDIKIKSLEEYLKSILGDVKIIKIEHLGKEIYTDEDVKGYGYGEPLLIHVKVGSEDKKLVLSTIKPGGFGHEDFSDRAKIILWNHRYYNKLPKHAKSVDVGFFSHDGKLYSVSDAEEFFQLVEYVEGREYFYDLDRMGREEGLSKLDVDRAIALSDYLVEIHSLKNEDYGLYRRRIRELIGHGEQIMGLIDSYKGDEDFLEPNELQRIEEKCLRWRWKLKDKGYRLCRVHGDFHPWNIKFREEVDFSVLDRSRGEWGEAADDVSALTINYLFFSLIYYGEFKKPFRKLWNIFIENYLNKTGDEELLKVIQPFYAWRGLVVASPIWYPNLEYKIRRSLFNFINNILDAEIFDYKNVDTYLR